MEYFDPEYDMEAAEKESLLPTEKTTAQSAEEVPDFIRESAAMLTEKLNVMMPSAFSLKEVPALRNQNAFYEASFPLLGQQVTEDLVPEINNRLTWNLLYVTCSTNKRHYRCVGFSEPTQDGCIIYYVESHLYGVTDHVTMAFYHDMLTMFEKLRADLFSLEERDTLQHDVYVLERVNEHDLWRTFFENLDVRTENKLS